VPGLLLQLAIFGAGYVTLGVVITAALAVVLAWWGTRTFQRSSA
jgi:DNA-binding transcriptional regulator of glucitol operon